ncbi:hypothetical protein [Planktothricoides raciborskii]|uniref:Uncharacterized protein n=1 Tax=Planktothricoides raciborskii FACHB-1370 TaxID=2949576 RepID=A0ABR8EAC0_9CYAN|nr:hypothetical protein [Planktothricoides raciborskii]MBD2543683.1 hypothetical protein [Planktothricoides raciborskii FACHB-1370]MBD2582424.1 hypothetical protein [Planktothricoides raciborskii FACHB-1261]
MAIRPYLVGWQRWSKETRFLRIGAIALSLQPNKKPGFYEHFGGVTEIV